MWGSLAASCRTLLRAPVDRVLTGAHVFAPLSAQLGAVRTMKVSLSSRAPPWPLPDARLPARVSVVSTSRLAGPIVAQEDVLALLLCQVRRV